MNSLHLGKFCPPTEGGMEVFVNDLLECLNKKGVKSDLLCFGKNSSVNSFRGFNYYSCKLTLVLNSAPFSFDFIKIFNRIKKNYDIIHIHSPDPLAEILSLFSKNKIVIHWHSDIVRQKFIYAFYKVIQKIVLKKANAIICTSPQYLESSKQIKGFKDKCLVIPIGLNPARLKNDEVNEDYCFKDVQHKKIILSMGRLVGCKGFRYLIEAAKFLSDDIVIFIAGDGPLFKKLQRIIHKKNLHGKVFLLGKVSNTSLLFKSLFKRCDLFCLPSVAESFGLVMVEALFFGKPIVSTNIEGSGVNFVNLNNFTGFTVPIKDPLALAGAINKILEDSDLCRKFSINAFERFREFEIDNIGEKIIKLYKEILITGNQSMS